MRSKVCKFSLLPILCMLTAIYMHAQAVPAHIDLYDGFETPTLSDLWATSRFAPGAVSIQS